MMNDKPVQGVYQGIDISGALLFEDDTGVRRFTSAEIMNVI
jgi:biotin-(acetyl-CoA carboxylase) ligase